MNLGLSSDKRELRHKGDWFGHGPYDISGSCTHLLTYLQKIDLSVKIVINYDIRRSTLIPSLN